MHVYMGFVAEMEYHNRSLIIVRKVIPVIDVIVKWVFLICDVTNDYRWL